MKLIDNNFDEAMEEIGWFGIFTIRLYAVMYLCIIFGAMNIVGAVFLAANVSHRCETENDLVQYVVEVKYTFGVYAYLENFIRSVYFTENSGYQSLKNRSCITVFGSCSATLTVGEPSGDVSDSANHDFRTSVTGICGEIDTSNFVLLFVTSFCSQMLN